MMLKTRFDADTIKIPKHKCHNTVLYVKKIETFIDLMTVFVSKYLGWFYDLFWLKQWFPVTGPKLKVCGSVQSVENWVNATGKTNKNEKRETKKTNNNQTQYLECDLTGADWVENEIVYF